MMFYMHMDSRFSNKKLKLSRHIVAWQETNLVDSEDIMRLTNVA